LNDQFATRTLIRHKFSDPLFLLALLHLGTQRTITQYNIAEENASALAEALTSNYP
jgi:hypothetical protein